MTTKHAVIHRMVMKDHICPFGLKALHLLRHEGYEVEDHWLRDREQTDAFKAAHQVDSTPQIFIEGQRIGGYDELRRHLGKGGQSSLSVYQPVVVVFAMAGVLALALSWVAFGSLLQARILQWFVAISMCLLAMLKLRDLESFSNTFLGYDLLARRYVPYASFYPFAEALAGVLMVAGALIWLAAPLAIFIGAIGSVSVFYAVYIQKRELKCACVGGDSSVPLGPVSLGENLLMLLMGGWMLYGYSA
ncbi:MauE/DoxX family redox-associated membrane protein [Pseudomonas yangonensis]|uniref:MauE/DoxX family redox-associated membrane protein n=2 Tax=Pseudomonas yangonensis TaxID=2579922 RepID=UPI00137B1D5E|nr:glutaredoxin [Pseudomonas yangonensis]